MVSAWWGLIPGHPASLSSDDDRNTPARYNRIRRRMIDQERIVIHSYDWLVDVAQSNNSGWLTSELR